MAWFATRQAGHVARRQLLAMGIGAKAIDWRVRGGFLIRVHPGVYLVVHRAEARWGREHAAVLACGPGALLSHRSAANIYGFLAYPAAGDVWVTTTAERGAGAGGVERTQTRVLERWDVWFIGWLPLTSPARTLLDLAGVVDDEQLEEAVAAAQVRRLVREEDLREQLSRRRGRRGAAALRGLLDRHVRPAATRSTPERLMLRLIRQSGLPEPLVNAKVGRWRPDFYWPEHHVVAEFDSHEFHADIRAFRRDREKSNDLQLMGITVLRFTWRELTRSPWAVEARLRSALALEASGIDPSNSGEAGKRRQ